MQCNAINKDVFQISDFFTGYLEFCERKGVEKNKEDNVDDERNPPGWEYRHRNVLNDPGRGKAAKINGCESRPTYNAADHLTRLTHIASHIYLKFIV
jgi:hypothetical protein